MSYTVYFCDVESTGLFKDQHEIVEICLWREGEEESKTWHIQALKPETISEEALKVNGHKKEDILGLTQFGKETYRHPSIVLPEIEEWLMADGSSAEERILVGQNIQFDHGFMAETWKRMGCKEDFPFGYWRNENENVTFTIDTIQLVRLIDMVVGKKRKFYNLGKLAKSFGVKKGQAHRADGDVLTTKNLFEKIIVPLKEVIINNFSDCYDDVIKKTSSEEDENNL